MPNVRAGGAAVTPLGPGPQQNRASVVILSDEETRRVRRFVARIGHVGNAARALGVGDTTLTAARGYGRMQVRTRAKLLDALTREEGAT